MDSVNFVFLKIVPLNVNEICLSYNQIFSSYQVFSHFPNITFKSIKRPDKRKPSIWLMNESKERKKSDCQ